MRTDIRSTRTNARLALPLAGAILAITLATPAQTAPEPPYAVTDVGANYRVWQRTVQLTNSATGEVTQQVQGYTDLEDGMNYLSNGVWCSAQDLIELTPTGAEAVQGQMTAKFSSDITSVGAISLATAAGEVFQSHPIGLFYADSASGKVAQIGRVQDSQGLLYAPNVIVFTNILSGLDADLMLVWARNGFEQNLVLKQSPPPPSAFGLTTSATTLQLWSAMDSCPAPREQRPVVLDSGLVDHILIFGCSWFPVGAAFSFGDAPLPLAGQAASVRLLSPSEPGTVPVAKSLVDISGQQVLIEEVRYADLVSVLSQLPQASLWPKPDSAVELVDRGAFLRPSPGPTPAKQPMQVASTPYGAKGVILDYTELSGSANYFTFSSNSTYHIHSSFSVGTGTATFQPTACIKLDTNAYFLVYGDVACSGSGPATVFTSSDDNGFGATITNSTANPGYAAREAIWMYYQTFQTTLYNLRVRWAQTDIRYDTSGTQPHLNSASLEDSITGLYLDMGADTLYLTQVSECNVIIPIYSSQQESRPGSDPLSYPVSGTVTTNCGVVSVAMVNDPNQDLIGTDTNKNTETECAFILANNSSTIVAAFADTHLSEVGFGNAYTFSNIVTPRSTWWAISTNGGVSFTNTRPLPPWGTDLTNTWKGDALNPMMTYDPNYPSNSSGTVYLLANPSREQSSWFGFRLWTSTNNGQSFTLINTNVPGGSSGPIKCDRPTVKVDPSTHYLYVAGTSSDPGGVGMFAARSTNQGINWDLYKVFDKPGGSTDIAIKPSGPVYVFWLAWTNTIGTHYSTRLRYAWLMPGSTNWSGTNDVGITLNCILVGGDRQALRFKGDSTNDWFEAIPFPRAVYANSHIYLAYSDLPSTNQSTTDQGDIFLAELAATNSDGSLTLTAPPRVVNSDHTQTDQWNPAIAVNPQGTELFIGYYSRQEDPTANSLIKAYGAKVYNIVNGLTNATIDCFPISPTAFLPLFSGTNEPTNLQFDPVYPPGTSVCFDQYARVDSLISYTNLYDCSTNDVEVVGNQWFVQDDNTWADADTNYFFYAWCDRSRPWTWTAFGLQNTRPDADVKLAKIRQ